MSVVNVYTFRGSNSAIIIFASLCIASTLIGKNLLDGKCVHFQGKQLCHYNFCLPLYCFNSDRKEFAPKGAIFFLLE